MSLSDKWEVLELQIVLFAKYTVLGQEPGKSMKNKEPNKKEINLKTNTKQTVIPGISVVKP